VFRSQFTRPILYEVYVYYNAQNLEREKKKLPSRRDYDAKMYVKQTSGSDILHHSTSGTA